KTSRKMNTARKYGMLNLVKGTIRRNQLRRKTPVPPCMHAAPEKFRTTRQSSAVFGAPVLRQLAEPQRIVMSYMFQRHKTGEHGPQGRSLAGCERGHVDVHGQKDGHQTGTAEMHEQADAQ